MKEKKPVLNKDIRIQDFRDFYWYKNELLEFCREENLSKSGGKLDLSKRIEKYLLTGTKDNTRKKQANTSKFDWNSSNLSLQTKITDNYRNTENVRCFFKQHLGDSFKFNVQFMNWMKKASGKSLGNAVQEWLKIKESQKTNKSAKKISPQFEYNTYIRDFLSDNPNLGLNSAIKFWKKKKIQRGDNKYQKTDLELK
ncbi:MAG: DUF6434 domain-containing protein [Bacteroidales bacterium]